MRGTPLILYVGILYVFSFAPYWGLGGGWGVGVWAEVPGGPDRGDACLLTVGVFGLTAEQLCLQSIQVLVRGVLFLQVKKT